MQYLTLRGNNYNKTCKEIKWLAFKKSSPHIKRIPIGSLAALSQITDVTFLNWWSFCFLLLQTKQSGNDRRSLQTQPLPVTLMTDFTGTLTPHHPGIFTLIAYSSNPFPNDLAIQVTWGIIQKTTLLHKWEKWSNLGQFIIGDRTRAKNQVAWFLVLHTHSFDTLFPCSEWMGQTHPTISTSRNILTEKKLIFT